MSNPDPSLPPPRPVPAPAESPDDTLAALHGLGSSDESEHDESPSEEDLQLQQAEAPEDGGASSAASGFVGMLAKEGAPSAPATSAPIRSNPDVIQMAREIPLADQDEARRAFPSAATLPRGKKPPKVVPGWYHGAIPVMFTLGALLLLIGIWAVGGLLYMSMQKPTEAEPGYLWIHTVVDEDTAEPAYTSGSKMMAAGMVVCLPVAIAMGIMGGLMQKQVSAARRRSNN